MMEENHTKLIETQNDTMWFEGSPLAVCAVQLALDVQTGDMFACVKFQNLRPQKLQSVTFDVICYDEFRKPLNRLTGLCFSDVSAERNAVFGYHRRIEIPDISVRNVEFIIQKTVFEDGSSWTNTGEKRFDTTLEQDNIYSVQGHYNKQFLDICTRSGINGMNLVLQPVFAEDHWLCACGAFNWSDEEKCSQCRVNRAWLEKSTNLTLLKEKEAREEEAARKVREQVAMYSAQQNNDLQKAEFEQRREIRQQELKHEKRRLTRRTICIIAAVLIVLALTAYLLMSFVFPHFLEGKEYKQAQNAKTAVLEYPQEQLLNTVSAILP